MNPNCQEQNEMQHNQRLGRSQTTLQKVLIRVTNTVVLSKKMIYDIFPRLCIPREAVHSAVI